MTGITPEEPTITLKGSGKGLRFVIPPSLKGKGLWEQFSSTLDQVSEMIRQVDIIIDFQDRKIETQFFLEFLSKCLENKVPSISSWETSDETTRALFRQIGLKSGSNEKKRPRRTGREETLVISNSLRSGQRIEHDGDVIILGHINDGAEVLASGNIIACGKLKGLVHGGINSGAENIIIAFSLEAKQVRLGGMVNSSLNEDHEWWGKAVRISSDGNSLRIRELSI